MPKAIFRFHAQLNDFLSKERRQVELEVTFNGHLGKLASYFKRMENETQALLELAAGDEKH